MPATYGKSLIALDGSELAENVLPYARSFAKALGIPVALLQLLIPETLVPSVVASTISTTTFLTAETEGIPSGLVENALGRFNHPVVLKQSL